MKDLNVRQETIKILEENTGNNLFDYTCSNFLLDTLLEARETKVDINYWHLVKIKKNFCIVKEIINKTKRQPTECGKIFANDILDKGLVSKICKELLQLNIQKINNPGKKWADDRNRHFSKEDIQMANRHVKRGSTSLIIREIHIKTMMRYHLTPFRGAIINNTGKTDIGKDAEKGEPTYTVGENANWYSYSGKQYGVSSES